MKQPFIIPENGAWVGPPLLIIELRGRREVLDGRRRAAEHAQRGLRTHIPEQLVHNWVQAVSALAHNGHPERAVEVSYEQAPELIRATRATLIQLLGLSHSKVVRFQRNLRAPAERHKLPRRATGVVKRLRTLRNRYLEGESITIDDIDHALGAFLED